MLAPGEQFDDDVIRSFCHFVHFFASPGDARAWLADHAQIFLLSVEDAFELGRLTNRLVYGDALRA